MENFLNSGLINIDMIDIQPTQRGFTNCSIQPSLPTGL